MSENNNTTKDKFKRAESQLELVEDSCTSCLKPANKTTPALSEMGEMCKLLLSEMHDGIIYTNTKNRIEWINREACKLLGEENPYKVIGESLKKFSNDSIVKDAKKFFTAVSTGNLSFLEFESKIHDRIVNFRVSPLQHMGKYVGILRVLRDVTAERKAQERLKLLAQAVESAVEAIYIISPQGKFEYVNPAFSNITGYRNFEVWGKSVEILKNNEDDESFLEEIWKTLRNRCPWSGRWTNAKKDGAIYTSECTISPVFDEEENIEHYVVVEKEITHELEIENQLRHTQKMEFIARFVSSIAHDFNNMLTAILGNAQVLSINTSPDDPIRPELDEILKASQSASGFINRLLSFSRRQPRETSVVNLNNILKEIGPLLQKLIGEDVQIDINTEMSLKNNRADQGQIEQIIANLAINARDAMPEGGRLYIETKNIILGENEARSYPFINAGNYTALIVRDEGIGIDKDIIDKIFEPYFTTKERGKGTGLGLSMVYSIVRQYGGDIRINSRPGKGSTFRILFPAVDDIFDHKTTMELERMAGGNETILLVEDEEVVLNFIEKTLRKLGYNVLTSTGSKRAKEIFMKRHDDIDLIMVDIGLPGKNGIKLVEEIILDNETADAKDIKVMYITGYPEYQSINDFKHPEGALLLRKPFTSTELAKTVRELLDQLLRECFSRSIIDI